MAHGQYDELTTAWGDWIAGLREWTLFGGQTFDQRRRRFMIVETHSKEIVERGIDKETGFPRVFWGSPVKYGYRLDAPQRVPRDVAIRRFERFHRRLERVIQKPVDYVCALQSHKNGWIHYHPLLAMGQLAGDEIRVINRLWREEAGGCDLTVIRDRAEVARYAARYLSRDISDSDVLLSRRLSCYVPD